MNHMCLLNDDVCSAYRQISCIIGMTCEWQEVVSVIMLICHIASEYVRVFRSCCFWFFFCSSPFLARAVTLFDRFFFFPPLAQIRGGTPNLECNKAVKFQNKEIISSLTNRRECWLNKGNTPATSVHMAKCVKGYLKLSSQLFTVSILCTVFLLLSRSVCVCVCVGPCNAGIWFCLMVAFVIMLLCASYIKQRFAQLLTTGMKNW